MRRRILILFGVVSSLLLFNSCSSNLMFSDAMHLYPSFYDSLVAIKLPLIEDQVESPLDTNEWILAEPNELGEIMIVMYHRLSEKEGTYDRSIEHFEEDLERLYNEGYRPVTLASVIEGTIDLPAGLSPVVLTFDDGHISNFKYLEDQHTLSDKSVVGILLAFQESHPDFKAHAVFYLTGPTPFGQRDTIEKKLKELVSLGFEVGNHTTNHSNLSKLNGEQISVEIGGMNRLLEEWSGEKVIHLSIPYGSRPKSEEAIEALEKSHSTAYTYEMKSIVNVGWKPIVSPYNKAFTPLSINRVICGEGNYSMHYWMDYFIEHPDKKYVSDGDLKYISIIEKDSVLLNDALSEGSTVRMYNKEE